MATMLTRAAAACSIHLYWRRGVKPWQPDEGGERGGPILGYVGLRCSLEWGWQWWLLHWWRAWRCGAALTREVRWDWLLGLRQAEGKLQHQRGRSSRHVDVQRWERQWLVGTKYLRLPSPEHIGVRGRYRIVIMIVNNNCSQCVSSMTT